MEIKRIPIKRENNGKIQYLTEVLQEIPTNAILCKTLTGLGATYGELKSSRNSIIIEPNTPVIDGKFNDPKHKDDNIMRVYAEVYRDNIIDYIQKSLKAGKKMKIMTTPESFGKVKEACEEIDMDIRFNFFLLFDECHKIIKDVDYRGDIVLPVDLFFECKNKALVSATPMDFSDPRFEQQGFTKIIIDPQFEYKKELYLHTTTNVRISLKKSLDQIKDDGTPIFIFCNSTDLTYAMMKNLNIIEDSYVFCSEKSVRKLKDMDVKDTSKDWSPKKMKHINWMTSRFYNAVDIELDVLPHVFIVTNCYYIDYTMVDPFTDVVQILGRFRNGIKSATHISNTNPNYSIRTHDQVLGYMECSKDIYETIQVLYDKSQRIEERDAYKAALEHLPHHNMLNERGQINWFRWDNEVDERMLKTYYNNPEILVNRYQESPMFETSHLHHTYHGIGDEEELILESRMNLKEKHKLIVQQLELLGKCETELEMELKRAMFEADPFIVRAYDILGKSKIEELKYSYKAISQAMIVEKYKRDTRTTAILESIKLWFEEGKWYADSFIKSKIAEIYADFQIQTPTGGLTANEIEQYFDVISKTKSNHKGKLLLKRKF